MHNSTLFALATGIADLPNDDARLAFARIVARVAQVERESFDVENFAQACGIARHLAPGLLAEPIEPLCPRCNQVPRMAGFDLCHSCQQFEDAD